MNIIYSYGERFWISRSRATFMCFHHLNRNVLYYHDVHAPAFFAIYIPVLAQSESLDSTQYIVQGNVKRRN